MNWCSGALVLWCSLGILSILHGHSLLAIGPSLSQLTVLGLPLASTPAVVASTVSLTFLSLSVIVLTFPGVNVRPLSFVSPKKN
jgi:hypothetical protein